MVLMCGPVFDALEYVESRVEGEPVRVLLTPQGERLTQSIAADLAKLPWLVMICGHYEGFDERIRTGIKAREISIGDYVLSGGEPAAMVLIDAVVRLLPWATKHRRPMTPSPTERWSIRNIPGHGSSVA
jgi:tRNA (guanine37-N1)-methyltransferase